MEDKIPTRVTVFDSTRIIVETEKNEDGITLAYIGFKKSKSHEDVYAYRSSESSDIFRMAEELRDMGIPFATDRTGGADYAVETFRSRGQLSGKFKRINFFGRDYSGPLRYSIEEF